MKIRESFIQLVSVIYVLLFSYTATDKLINFEYSRGAMDAQVFDDSYTPFLVWFIPGIELIIAGLILFKKTRLLGLFSGTFLMLAFTIYVGLVTFNFFERVPCACGGIFKTLSWPQHLTINISIFLLGVIGIILFYKNDLKGTSPAKKLIL